MRDVSSFPGRHIMHYTPGLCIRDKKMLLGSCRKLLVDWGGYPPTDIHIWNHTGQYLFFIAFSTRCTVAKQR